MTHVACEASLSHRKAAIHRGPLPVLCFERSSKRMTRAQLEENGCLLCDGCGALCYANEVESVVVCVWTKARLGETDD